jgi:hypothetical protein
MKRKLRILFVSPEMAPFTPSIRPGSPAGLAESTRALAAAVAARGASVSMVLPRYRRPEIDALPLEIILPELWVPLGEDKVKAVVSRAILADGEAYFIDSPKYFLRDHVFGTEHGDYLDNDERFVFFNRAVLEFILKAKLAVDVIHCRNWPSALVPLFLRTHYAQRSHFKDTATVLSLPDSVYDPASQGRFPPESLAFTGLNWDFFTPGRLAHNGKFNFLKAGVLSADVLSGTHRYDYSRVAPPASVGAPSVAAAVTAAGTVGRAVDAAGSPASSSSRLPPADSEAGFAEVLAGRRDTYFPLAAGPGRAADADAAGEYLLLYEKALNIRKGGLHGR